MSSFGLSFDLLTRSKGEENEPNKMNDVLFLIWCKFFALFPNVFESHTSIVMWVRELPFANKAKYSHPKKIGVRKREWKKGLTCIYLNYYFAMWINRYAIDFKIQWKR